MIEKPTPYEEVIAELLPKSPAPGWRPVDPKALGFEGYGLRVWFPAGYRGPMPKVSRVRHAQQIPIDDNDLFLGGEGIELIDVTFGGGPVLLMPGARLLGWDVDGACIVGAGSVLEIKTQSRGLLRTSVVGDGCVVGGPNVGRGTVIRESSLGDGTKYRPFIDMHDYDLAGVAIGARVDASAGLWAARCTIGNDTKIGGASIHARASVGPGCQIGHAVVVKTDASIGARVVLKDDVEIGGYAIVEEGVTVGTRARIGTGVFVDRDVKPGEHISQAKETVQLDSLDVGATPESYIVSRLAEVAESGPKQRLDKKLVQQQIPTLVDHSITKQLLRKSPPPTADELRQLASKLLDEPKYTVTLEKFGWSGMQRMGRRPNDVLIFRMKTDVLFKDIGADALGFAQQVMKEGKGDEHPGGTDPSVIGWARVAPYPKHNALLVEEIQTDLLLLAFDPIAEMKEYQWLNDLLTEAVHRELGLVHLSELDPEEAEQAKLGAIAGAVMATQADEAMKKNRQETAAGCLWAMAALISGGDPDGDSWTEPLAEDMAQEIAETQKKENDAESYYDAAREYEAENRKADFAELDEREEEVRTKREIGKLDDDEADEALDDIEEERNQLNTEISDEAWSQAQRDAESALEDAGDANEQAREGIRHWARGSAAQGFVRNGQAVGLVRELKARVVGHPVETPVGMSDRGFYPTALTLILTWARQQGFTEVWVPDYETKFAYASYAPNMFPPRSVYTELPKRFQTGPVQPLPAYIDRTTWDVEAGNRRTAKWVPIKLPDDPRGRKIIPNERPGDRRRTSKRRTSRRRVSR